VSASANASANGSTEHAEQAERAEAAAAAAADADVTSAKPRRAAGAVVVLVGEQPVLFFTRGGKHVLTLAEPSAEAWPAIVEALRVYARTLRGKTLRIEQIDGHAVRSSAVLAERFVAHGFSASYRGLELG
jgi:ATP-dependent Lhr-like helicase